eukprot:TRINITY_DN13068_c0_g2_i2.p1 TRINITY_DN13068_c0_g2~~TRINITY_DN13068_c0_g2_i2.p1  ORF type:complete len:103 (+),score=2.55 TRINITY_DN13068_c0_g2_i2:150-458(+)
MSSCTSLLSTGNFPCRISPSLIPVLLPTFFIVSPNNLNSALGLHLVDFDFAAGGEDCGHFFRAGFTPEPASAQEEEMVTGHQRVDCNVGFVCDAGTAVCCRL